MLGGWGGIRRSGIFLGNLGQYLGIRCCRVFDLFLKPSAILARILYLTDIRQNNLQLFNNRYCRHKTGKAFNVLCGQNLAHAGYKGDIKFY